MDLNSYLAVVRAARLSGEILTPSQMQPSQTAKDNKINRKRILTFKQFMKTFAQN